MPIQKTGQLDKHITYNILKDSSKQDRHSRKITLYFTNIIHGLIVGNQ